jgi:nucleoside-diphosphate-sugar epimerase
VIVPLRQRSHRTTLSHMGLQQTPIRPLEDMTQAEWLPLLVGVNAVIHAAAIAHIGEAVPESHYQLVNATASGRLAEAAAQAGVDDFIFVSSIRAQVGATSDVIQTEATLPEPSEPYGCSKLAAERLITAVFSNAITFRPALIVGGKPKANLAGLVKLADTPFPLPFGGLSAPQAMVSLEHFIEAIMLALRTPTMRGETYVVADEPHPSLADMLTFLREGMGRPSRLISFPTALLTAPLKLLGKANIAERLMGGLQVDAGKLRSAGWQPKGSPAETLRVLGRNG